MSTQAGRLPFLRLPFRRRARRRPTLARIAAGFIVTMVLVALLAPLIAPYDPSQLDLSSINAGPSATHLLGTDASGRDILSRLIWGARTALLGPLLVASIAGVLGCTIAIAAAWLRGPFDAVSSRALDVIFAFPGILLALVAVAVLGSGLPAAIGALSIAYIPYIARVIRSEALRQSSQLYVECCRINGFSGLSVARRHLIPNLLPLIVAQISLSFGYAMVDLASISYLGLGVQAPSSDWGLMVQEGQASIVRGYPEQSLYASGLIVAVVLAFTVLGDHLIARHDERES